MSIWWFERTPCTHENIVCRIKRECRESYACTKPSYNWDCFDERNIVTARQYRIHMRLMADNDNARAGHVRVRTPISIPVLMDAHNNMSKTVGD